LGRQKKRAKACTKKLRTNLGRVIREIERQAVAPALASVLETSKRIHARKIDTKDKVHSVHEPETKCIAKGNAGKKYEFGQKVSAA
jgi:IS5 family transposase